MTHLTYAAKADANQEQIVEDLRALGYDVDLVFRIKDLYDLIVSGIPTWCPRPVAVRVELKINEKAKLSPDELEYWEKQRHLGNLIVAVRTEDILKWFGRINHDHNVSDVAG